MADHPAVVLELWAEINSAPAAQCLLVNLYRTGRQEARTTDREEEGYQRGG